MARVRANTDFDVEQSEKVLSVLENLSRDMENIEDRQNRLQELGIALKIEFKNGEIVVRLDNLTERAPGNDQREDTPGNGPPDETPGNNNGRE